MFVLLQDQPDATTVTMTLVRHLISGLLREYGWNGRLTRLLKVENCTGKAPVVK